MPLRWTEQLSDGSSVTCLRQEGGSDSQSTAYRLELPLSNDDVDELTVTAPGAAVETTAIRNRESDANSKSSSIVSVSLDDTVTIERIILDWAGGREVLYLPSNSFLESCESAIDGSASAARSVLEAFQTPVQLPMICGAFLDIPKVVDLVDVVTDSHRHAASIVHSFRYPIIRGALVDSAGLSVSTASDLETLVDGFDSIDAIGPVTLLDCVADSIATTHDSVAETERLITSLGYDLKSFETGEDGRFFACHLAQTVLAEGIDSAHGHAMSRRRHLDVNYERKKTEALNTPHSERAEKWRQLICPAARKSMGEFVYVLANALYWTGYSIHSDSRMQELLHAAATAAADNIDLPQLEAWATFERHVAAGHRLRRKNQFAGAVGRFEEATEVARRHDFLPTWDVRYNEIVVRAHARTTANDRRAAIDVIETGIEELLQYDLNPDTVNRVIRHLKGQQLEIEAEVLEGSDSEQAHSALSEARNHYDAIGFTRSRDRVSRKLTTVEKSLESVSTSSSGTASSSANTQPSRDSASTNESLANPDSSDDTSQSGSGPKSEPASPSPSTSPSPPPSSATEASPSEDSSASETSRTAPDSFSEPDEYPHLDDSLTPHDESKVGSGDIMSGPDAERDDPFLPEGDPESGWYDGSG